MEPLRVYKSRLREPQKILQLCEETPQPDSTQQEARRQFLVAVAAASELFWRVFIRANVDRSRHRPNVLERFRKTTFTLSDVHRIIGRKLTLGELIAAAYSFQGTEAVNTSLSEILQINVFSEFAKEKFVVVEDEWYKCLVDAAYGTNGKPPRTWKKNRKPLEAKFTGRDILKRDCVMVDHCYTIRHDSVHSFGRIYKPSARETIEIANAVWEFNAVLALFIESRFKALWGTRAR